MHAKVSPLRAEATRSVPEDTLDEGGRESTRPIRGLNRGLEVLIELNRLERAPINTLAAAVNLPRTTTYLILTTLRPAGYVERDTHDDCYRPTIRLRSLSEGFDDEALVPHIARPLLGALGAPARVACRGRDAGGREDDDPRSDRPREPSGPRTLQPRRQGARAGLGGRARFSRLLRLYGTRGDA